jgi:hypothetical protein
MLQAPLATTDLTMAGVHCHRPPATKAAVATEMAALVEMMVA